MAQILSFRTPEFRSSEGSDLRIGVSAEVIIFPGIRYEHWDEKHAVTNVTGDERRPSRDVIELAE